jgi:hypothetical protein
MTTEQFATISIRVLGVAFIAIGGVLAGSCGIMRVVDAASLTNIPTSDLHLHDTYYVISHIEDAWLVPGAVSIITGILLLITSRRIGALLARGTGIES